MDPSVDPKNLGRSRMGIDLNVVPLPVPEIMGIGQQILDLEWPLFLDSQTFQIQFEPARMHMMWAQIDHDEYNVRPIRGSLAVAEQLVVCDIMKVQTPVALKRGI